MSDDYILLEGDCVEVMRNLPDCCVDCVLTDPPYGTTACKWDAVVPFDAMWAQVLRITKPSAAILLHASQPFTSSLLMSQPRLYRHEWVWIKNRGSNFANTNREPMKEHEVVLMFSRGKWTYNKQMQERTGGGRDRVKYRYTEASDTTTEHLGAQRVPRKEVGTELRVPSSWQKFNTEVGLHPTQKPVDLLRYLIRTYTNEGEVVLDFTCGSGSTGVAALRENRKFIGIEREHEYFVVCENRLKSVAAERQNES